MFLLPTLLTGCGQIRSLRLRRQLSLGNKYLLESDYEAAELALKKAIEIDPKEPRYLKVVWGVGYKVEKI